MDDQLILEEFLRLSILVTDPDPDLDLDLEVSVDEGTGNRTATETETEGIRMQEIVPMEQLIEILECSVCLEIPFPPILNCVQGHIVCSACRPRMSHCGICRVRFLRDDRNYPLEGIVLGSSFSCKYKALGCKDIILGSTFFNHLKICQYNPFFVLCNETRGTPCKNALLRTNKYLQHLKGQHNRRDIKAQYMGGQWNQSYTTTYRHVQVDDSTHMGQMIKTDYFELKGEAFVQKWQFEDNLYYTWVCKLNSTPTSLEGLEVTISVRCATSENKAKFSSTTLRVHDATLSLKDVKATGQFLALHPSQLLAFGGTGTEKIEDRIWDLYWNSEVQIRQNFPALLTTTDYNDDADWS